MFVHRRFGAALVAAAGLALPGAALACACGCGVFDVGDATLIPGGTGGSAWLEDDVLDQTRNWSGTGASDAALDSDKRITTDFVTLGGQYMAKCGLGVMVQLPFATRDFTTVGDDGVRRTFRHAGLGDLRVNGVWSFTKDMSTGVSLGLKLPTGSFAASGFDRDVQLGSGTTDLLLGGYHIGALGKAAAWNWFAQGQWDHPLNMRSGYRPGDEVDAAVGLGWMASAPTAKVAFTPMLQLIGSRRAADSGPAADPDNSGYTRLLAAPAVEVKTGKWKLYGDVEVPFYQSVRGQQLIAPVQAKFILSRAF